MNGHLSHVFGSLAVVTSPLEARPGYFISCVMRNGLPWDANISSSAEDAAASHKKFCVMASVFAPIVDQMADQGVIVNNMPNPCSLN